MPGTPNSSRRRYKRIMTQKEREAALAEAVGRRLSWLRAAIDQKQQQMFKGKSAQTQWSRFERGERLIKPVQALEICDRFQVSMDYIYRGHLNGVHPALAEVLYNSHPQLVLPPIYTGWSTDTDQA